MSINLTSLTMLLFIIGEEVIQGILWCFTILLLLLRLQKKHRAVFQITLIHNKTTLNKK